jgi:hypothetical protein
MTALDRDFQRPSMGGPVLSRGFAIPLQALARVYKGSAVAINSVGTLVPASADPTLQVVGVAEDGANNTTGLSLTAIPLIGNYYFSNSGTTDAITDGDIGKLCFAANDNTAARTSALGTRPVLGRVVGVDTLGVLVAVGMEPANADGSVDLLIPAGADLSARRHHPVKLSSNAVVAATVAGEQPLGILQNAPASGAIARVRISGISRIVLGDTLTQGMKIAVEATSGRAKEAVAGTVDVSGGAVEDLTGSYAFGILITGGADGDTGLCFVNHMGAIPTAAA